MGANVMMNLVEDTVITVQRGQPTPQVAPLLTPAGNKAAVQDAFRQGHQQQ
jgi:hypothetical protein